MPPDTPPPRDPIAALRELVEAAEHTLAEPRSIYGPKQIRLAKVAEAARSTLEAVEGGERDGESDLHKQMARVENGAALYVWRVDSESPWRLTDWEGIPGDTDSLEEIRDCGRVDLAALPDNQGAEDD